MPRGEARFRVTKPDALTIIQAGDNSWMLCQGPTEVSLPAPFEPLVIALLDGRSFGYGTLPPLGLDDVYAATEVLLGQGIVEVVAAAGATH